MQPRSSTDIGQPNTKRTERIYNRLPLLTQGQTPIQYNIIIFLNFIVYYNPKKMNFDVAFRIMDFMWKNKLNPSKALVEEYRLSKTTKALNRFPSYEELKEIGIDEYNYDKLKNAYKSKII